jgi:AcrR family transcriptional regulator
MQPATAEPAPQTRPADIDLQTRRKLRTRRALQEAALQLFAAHGYDQTTIAQIAQRAGVGKRTFFLHFPAKEDVLFTSALEGFGELGALVAAAPPQLSDLDAVEQAVVQLERARGHDPVDHRLTELLVIAARTSSVVRGKQMEYLDAVRATLAAAIAQRHREQRPSTATVISADIATRAFHLAVTQWATSDTEQMAPIVRHWFAALRTVASDPARCGRPG